MNSEPTQPSRKRDLGFWAIVTLVGIVAVWLVLTPIVPAVASATMHRFHLASDSFAIWAIQFPIPAMYNFSNRVTVHGDQATDPVDIWDRAYINHFPAKICVVGGARYHLLRSGEDRWYVLESTYRGQTLRSNLHARPIGDGRFQLERLPDPLEKP